MEVGRSRGVPATGACLHAGLLGAVPAGHRARETLANIPGAPPHLAALPPGCRFAPRCAFVHPMCRVGQLDPLR